MSSAGGVCLRRDWSAVDQQGVVMERSEERREERREEWLVERCVREYGVVRGRVCSVARSSRFGSSLLNGWLRGGQAGGRGRRNGVP